MNKLGAFFLLPLFLLLSGCVWSEINECKKLPEQERGGGYRGGGIIYPRDNCLFDLSLNHTNPEICNEINQSNIKENCLFVVHKDLAIASSNPLLCHRYDFSADNELRIINGYYRDGNPRYMLYNEVDKYFAVEQDYGYCLAKSSGYQTSFCELASGYSKDFCIIALSNAVGVNYTLCSDIEELKMREDCFNHTISSSTPLTEEYCSNVAVEKDDCWLALANNVPNQSVCERIEDTALLQKCLTDVYYKSGYGTRAYNESLCDRLLEASFKGPDVWYDRERIYYDSYCYFKIGACHHNFTYDVYGTERSECYYWKAIGEKNETFCNYITTPLPAIPGMSPSLCIEEVRNN